MSKVEMVEPSPIKLPADAGLAATITGIRERLCELETAPLDEDHVEHLGAIYEWLADLAWAYREDRDA